MRSLNRAVQKVARAVYKIFFAFATAAFAFLLIILLYNVFSRNFLTGAVAEIEEGSRFVFTWMMFLGISIGVYHKKHLGVEFLVANYPPALKKFFVLVSNILTIVLFIVLTIYGFRYSFSTMRMYSPIMNVPYGMVYLCVPLCGIFSLFYCFARFMDDMFGDKEEEDK